MIFWKQVLHIQQQTSKGQFPATVSFAKLSSIVFGYFVQGNVAVKKLGAIKIMIIENYSICKLLTSNYELFLYCILLSIDNMELQLKFQISPCNIGLCEFEWRSHI